ncbi:SDR family NAD(P)-dependent oxidoreductase [Chloroflexota bacterium]
MGRLEGKVSIITGAGSGMGRVAAKLFAKEGAKVVAVDWVAESGEETVKSIRDDGGEAIFIKADVSKEDNVEKMVKVAVDSYDRLDIIYNNAGVADFLYDGAAPTAECTMRTWDNVTGVDLKGVWLGMKYAIPQMIKTGGGSIISVASIAGTRGVPNLPAYTASKAGLIGLSRAAAIEYATKNIRVNVISPGQIATDLMMKVFEEDDAAKSKLKQFLSSIPFGRMGEPEEVVKVALFLASDDSSYVTGQVIAVDGGMYVDSHVAV